MKQSTYTSSLMEKKAKLKKMQQVCGRGALGSYRLLVKLASEHKVIGLGGLHAQGNSNTPVLVKQSPQLEYLNSLRLLTNMYNSNAVDLRTARRTLRQVGWLCNFVAAQNKPQMTNTVFLSNRAIFGFARRIFAMSSKFEHFRSTPASQKSAVDNRLWSSTAVRYRRMGWGSRYQLKKRTLLNHVFNAHLWRAVKNLKHLVVLKGAHKRWWQGPWNRIFEKQLAPYRNSSAMSWAYKTYAFNRNAMRALFVPRYASRYTNWLHDSKRGAGRFWVTPFYFSKRGHSRRYPRHWRKTKRYAKLKRQRNSWMNRVAGCSFRSSRTKVGTRSGVSYDGSYAYLTYLSGGNRVNTPVYGRLAMRRVIYFDNYLRHFKATYKRAARRAMRNYLKYDRSEVLLPKVPRSNVTGNFTMSPRIGYARLNRFLSSRRPAFRAAKIFKVRKTGEWLHQIANVARKLFYKRFQNWQSANPAVSAQRVANYHADAFSSSFSNWGSLIPTYAPVSGVTLPFKANTFLRGVIRRFGAISAPGQLLESGLSVHTPYDTLLRKPHQVVSILNGFTDKYMQWSASRYLNKIRARTPGKPLPRLFGDDLVSTTTTAFNDRKQLSRKLGFVDKFLAYSIVFGAVPLSGSNKPYRRALARVSEVADTGFDSRLNARLKRGSLVLKKSLKNKRVCAKRFPLGSADNTGTVRSVYAFNRDHNVSVNDHAGTVRSPSVDSRWVETAFGLKRFTANSGNGYSIDKPYLSVPQHGRSAFSASTKPTKVFSVNPLVKLSGDGVFSSRLGGFLNTHSGFGVLSTADFVDHFDYVTKSRTYFSKGVHGKYIKLLDISRRLAEKANRQAVADYALDGNFANFSFSIMDGYQDKELFLKRKYKGVLPKLFQKEFQYVSNRLEVERQKRYSRLAVQQRVRASLSQKKAQGQLTGQDKFVSELLERRDALVKNTARNNKYYSQKIKK